MEEIQTPPSNHHDHDGHLEKPSRPLTAYNLFFQHERKLLVMEALKKEYGSNLTPAAMKHFLASSRRRPHRKVHGVISFRELTRKVSTKWKSLDGPLKQQYKELSIRDKQRYKQELKVWRDHQLERSSLTCTTNASTWTTQSSTCMGVGADGKVGLDTTSTNPTITPNYMYHYNKYHPNSSSSSSSLNDCNKKNINHEFHILSTWQQLAQNYYQQEQKQESSSKTPSPPPPSILRQDNSPVAIAPLPPLLPDYPVVSDEIVVPDNYEYNKSCNYSCGTNSNASSRATTNHHDNDDDDDDFSSCSLPPLQDVNESSSLSTLVSQQQQHDEKQDFSSSSMMIFPPPPPPFANHRIVSDVILLNSDDERVEESAASGMVNVVDVNTTMTNNNNNNNNNNDIQLLASELDSECVSFIISLKQYQQQQQQQEGNQTTIDIVPL